MVATCGFDSRGRARVAAPNYDCRVDARNGIWGFCPSSVINAWDCGLAGYCVDQHDCSDGCGPLKDRDDITTFTCSVPENYCSTVISDNDFGQSFLQVGCGLVATRETIYANPPSTSATTTTSSSTTVSTSPTTIPSPSATSQTSRDSLQSSLTTPPPTASSIVSTTEAPSLPAFVSATSDADSNSKSDSSLPLGPIIGGAVGGISVVCLTVFAIFYIRHRNRRASSRHSTPPLRRSSSCNKHDTREEPYGAYELGAQPNQYFEASELNRDPAELPGYEVTRQVNNEHK